MKKTAKIILVLVLALLMLASTALASGVSGNMANFKAAREYEPFTDVENDAWYFGDVKTAYELGIINGRGGGIFDPAGTLNIAEAITMAVRTCCVYAGQELPSTDCSPWYQNMVDYAVDKGIINADEFDDYSAKATRGDMIDVFSFALPFEEYQRINRVLGIPDTSDSCAYLLYNAGILIGDENANCNIKADVKRCEAAAIINRIAIPENRKSVTGVRPEGILATSTDGSFNMVIPDNGKWEIKPPTEEQLTEDENFTPLINLDLSTDDDFPAGAWVFKLNNKPADGESLFDFCSNVIKRDQELYYSEEGYAPVNDLTLGIFRGFLSVYGTYKNDTESADYTIIQTKPGTLYMIVLQYRAQEEDSVFRTLFTFDAEL